MQYYEIERLLSMYKTPFYIFDINILKQRIQYLRKALPHNVSLCYAVKANTFILKEMSDLIERFEVCSYGELKICQAMELPPEKLVISGVAKDVDDICNLFEARIPVGIYTIESIQQYELLITAATQFNIETNVILRLTSGNQFGLDKEEIRRIVSKHKETPCINIRGIQYFSGTQKNSNKRLKKEISNIVDFIKELSEVYECDLKELEFGPGLPVTYFTADTYDEEQYLKEFSEVLNTIDSHIKVTLELGRSIAYSCGRYFTKVIDMKTNKNQNYAIVDGGIHHLVYYGQSMAMRIPKYQIYQEKECDENILSKSINWNICGSLCTINDILVKQIPINNLQIGDVIIFENTGAYCATEGISLFLSRDLPQVILIDEDYKSFVVRDSVKTYFLNKPIYGREKYLWKD